MLDADSTLRPIMIKYTLLKTTIELSLCLLKNDIATTCMLGIIYGTWIKKMGDQSCN